ncbi:MAG: exonuclease domain-containing protein [Lutibacter sp.]
MYAILDIETTGGKYNEEGITEIAIYKFDRHQIIDQFISLVNPEREIQPFVVKLTGINNAMLKNAPKFFEIAKRILEITKDCILVAHNASFDTRILSTEFRRLGFEYHKQSICTVELSKKLIPGLNSYKLGKLCRSLGIPVASRHRAEGDAMATVQLFKLLLDKDLNKEIVQKFITQTTIKKLDRKLQDILDELPSKTGVFYVHNGVSKILYIGKGKNIKRAVNKLFLRTSKKAQAIQKLVTSITYDDTGNTLLASLKFEAELKLNMPKFNYQNNRIIPKVNFNNDNFLIVDKGREVGEKSILLFENGDFKGFCYTDLNYQINNLDVLHSLISEMDNNLINRYIIKKYLQKNKVEKIIRY